VIDVIILCCIIALVALGVLSFYLSPAYSNGVWIVVGAITNVLSGAAGAKFGLAVPTVVSHMVTQDQTSPAAAGNTSAIGFVPGEGAK